MLLCQIQIICSFSVYVYIQKLVLTWNFVEFYNYTYSYAQFVLISRRKKSHPICVSSDLLYLPLSPFLAVLLCVKTENQTAPYLPQKPILQNKQQNPPVSQDWVHVSLLASLWLLCPVIVLADVLL